jgi:hypothetical protein
MGHSAPAGRTAPISHGGFSSPGPMRFGGPVRTPQVRPPYEGYARTSGRGTGWNQGDRDREGDRDHRRRPYYRGIGLGYGYASWPGYPFLWNDPGSYGYGDANYDSYGAPYADANGPAAPYADYGEPVPPYPGDAGPGYAGPAAPYNYGTGAAYPPSRGAEPQGARPSYTGPGAASNAPAPQQAVTLIFKDGRPSEQIHNYLLTATTLTVLDQKYREIPVDQINLYATEETNRADGIDFRVPSVPQAREYAPAN